MASSVTRRGFLAGGIGLLAGAFGAKLLPHTTLPVLVPRLPPGTFLFDPAIDPVTMRWADLMTDVMAYGGARTIIIDSTRAPAHVSAGTWDLEAITFVTSKRP
jgi:hypothetical protein